MMTTETETKTPQGKADDLKKDMADLSTEEKPTVATKKKPIRRTKAKTESKKGNGAADPNQITLKQLCKDYKLEPRIARRKLRLAGLKPEGRWSWEKGSSSLKKAETALAASGKD
jgi:hypothetical protein